VKRGIGTGVSRIERIADHERERGVAAGAARSGADADSISHVPRKSGCRAERRQPSLSRSSGRGMPWEPNSEAHWRRIVGRGRSAVDAADAAPFAITALPTLTDAPSKRCQRQHLAVDI
jgi:hypothetical protein